MRYRIAIAAHEGHFTCHDNQSVLEASIASGRGDLQVGCRSGGCGVCKVQVLAGDYRTGVMSFGQVDEVQRTQGYALACKLYPQSDLHLRVAGRPAGAVLAAMRQCRDGAA